MPTIWVTPLRLMNTIALKMTDVNESLCEVKGG